jgi:acyl-CoA dehydrogenase
MIKDETALTVMLNTVRDFVKERLIPIEEEVAESDHIPEEIVGEMRDMGLFGLSIPEEYGGLGLTLEEEMNVIMELCHAAPCFRSVIGTSVGIGGMGIVFDGTEEQKNKYLPKIASGEWPACFCLTEPDAGSDAGAVKTTAVKDGDSYIINGTKRFITNAPESGVYMVYARTNPAKKGAPGVSAFIVDRGTPGLVLGKNEKKMGQGGAHISDVIFEDCRVPADALLGGQLEKGFITAMKVLDKGRTHVGAVCVGSMERIIDEALRYAMDRKQFGQPISDFQLVQAMLADSKMEAYAAKCMVLETARAYDRKENITSKASCTKLFASEAASRVADRGVQILGGSGYIREYPCERFYRDVRVYRLYEGTSQIHQIIIARELIRAMKG